MRRSMMNMVDQWQRVEITSVSKGATSEFGPEDVFVRFSNGETLRTNWRFLEDQRQLRLWCFHHIDALLEPPHMEQKRWEIYLDLLAEQSVPAWKRWLSALVNFFYRPTPKGKQA